jgi:hypothetical protein
MKRGIMVLLCLGGLLLACSAVRADFWDEFPGPPLNPGWRINSNDSTHWSLTARPGYLQILTQYYPNGGDTMWNNFYHLERLTGDFEVSARIVARPDSAGQAAVLYAEYDSTNQGQPNAVILYGNDFIGGQLVWGTINHRSPNYAAYSDTVVYLRLRKHGDTAFAEYSPNGTSWTTLTQGSPFGNHWISGFNAANLQEMGAIPQTPPMAANYDWFHLTALTGVEETAEGRGQRLEVRITATPNPFASFARVPGHETGSFALYDVSGRQVGTYQGDRIGEGLAPGVYFLKGMGIVGAAPVRIVKVR